MSQMIGVASKERIYAAMGDYAFAAFFSLMSIILIGIQNPVFNGIVLSTVYLGYFFFFELVFGRTPGKMSTGITIQTLNGEPYGLRQVSLRTVTRILETNPLFFGGLPAGIFVALSEKKQRLGDILAETIVVVKD